MSEEPWKKVVDGVIEIDLVVLAECILDGRAPPTDYYFFSHVSVVAREFIETVKERDEMAEALAVALNMWEHHADIEKRNGSLAGARDMIKIAELRAKFLSGDK
jgi:hypothetical protein